MDIVIIADFCGRFDGSENSRFLYLTDMLKKDHDIEIITSDFDHRTKSHFDQIPKMDGYKVTMLHEPSYSKNISIKRFLAHAVWGSNVKSYLKKRKRPDVVYCAIPPLSMAKYAARYCEKNVVRYIIDVQDLWPEAFQMVFNIPIISKAFFLPFNMIINGAYKRADEIIAVSQTYVDRALRVNEKCKKGHCVFIGTNLNTFYENVKNNPVLTKPKDELWLGYCGTLGASYDLTTVFDALSIIMQKGIVPPKFVVMGTGPKEDEFKKKALNLNVEFTGRLPYPQMCGMLAACDIVVNPIMHNAAQSIINKHADYAASGLPVINTQECEEYRELVDSYNMGFNCRNNDAEDMADKLCILISDKELREEMGKNAYKCAVERFDRQHSYQEILEVILK